jgi:hypothetical protein
MSGELADSTLFFKPYPRRALREPVHPEVISDSVRVAQSCTLSVTLGIVARRANSFNHGCTRILDSLLSVFIRTTIPQTFVFQQSFSGR